MSSKLAPIAVFAYKRPEHLAKTLESLSQCALAAESEVFIFCDGAKNKTDEEAVRKTREVAHVQKWAKKINVFEREKNLGLSKSIVGGVTELCERFGRVIVVEDDLRLAPTFLEYMNQALELYKDDKRVMEISGYMYPVESHGEHDAFFMVHASCWGWGTWKRAWQHFGEHLDQVENLKRDRKARYAFDMNGAYKYFDMLQKQLAGQIDSWGILWYLTLFAQNGLCLFPRQTLVENIGQDASGTHVETVHFEDHLSNFIVKSFPHVGNDEKSFGVFQRFICSKHGRWWSIASQWVTTVLPLGGQGGNKKI